MTGFVCEPLAKSHDRRAFRCGDAGLDAYLHHQAAQDMRRRVAAVCVAVPEDQPQRIAGFYALSSASIVLDDLPPEMSKRLPRYPAVPAVLLGRLARDVGFPGIGKLLLVDALSRALRSCDEVAAAVMLVDAKHDAARQFYGRYGFQEVLHKPNRMFLPMKTVEKLLGRQS